MGHEFRIGSAVVKPGHVATTILHSAIFYSHVTCLQSSFKNTAGGIFFFTERKMHKNVYQAVNITEIWQVLFSGDLTDGTKC